MCSKLLVLVVVDSAGLLEVVDLVGSMGLLEVEELVVLSQSAQVWDGS